MAEDFAENHNVAADHRDRLIAMIGTWYVEAGKYNVMPVDGSGLARMIAEKPLVALPRDSYTYRPGTQSIPFFAAPRVLNRPHSITADVEIPSGGAEGVLLSQGTSAGGYSLFVKDGKLRMTAPARGGAGPAGHSVAGARFPPSGPIRSRQSWQSDAAWSIGLPRSPWEPDKFMDRGGVSLVAQDLTVRGHRGPGRTRPREVR